MSSTYRTKAELSAALSQAEARIARLEAKDNTIIQNPLDTEIVIRNFVSIKTLEQEHFWVVLLNAKLQVLQVLEIARGTVNQVHIHPRDIFREAIRFNAFSVVVAHNHPSGDVLPSGQDDELTNRLRQVGQLLGIPLVDHLILTERECYSYASKVWAVQ